MVVCVCFLIFSFLRFWQEDSTQEVQFGEWPASCVVDGVLWPDFHYFFLEFLKLDLRMSIDFC
jgi:hypothetical protein